VSVRRSCELAAVGPAGEESIDCCTAGAQQQPRRSSGVQLPNAGSVTLLADVGS